MHNSPDVLAWETEPLIDRNPQRYVPNIFDATDADFQKATHTIFRSATYPSHLELSVVPR